MGVVANIKGPAGNTGPTGPTGPTGNPGAPGSVWFNGAGAPSDATTGPAGTVRLAAGTSASGTAATTVAEIVAAAGKKLVAWTIHAAQTSATSTQLKVIVTYADATTTTDTSVAATATTVLGNAGGLERTAAGAHVALVAGLAKDVTRLRVETAGTGTGTRSAAIAALEL